MSSYTRNNLTNTSEDSKKLVMAIAVSAILLGGLYPAIAVAQTPEQGQEEQQPQQTQQQPEVFIEHITTPIDGFTARGDIGSLVFAVNETEVVEPQNGEANQTAPLTVPQAIRPPFVLTGDWDLAVENGTVTMFDTSFVMVRTDGTNYHTINLTNFMGTDEEPVTIGPETERISGTVNVLANGTILHEGEPITITLGGLVMAIHFGEGDTREHFKGLPIFGTISSVVGADGTIIVGVTEAEDVPVEEPTVTPTPEQPPMIEETPGFTGDPTTPFEPYEGLPPERGLIGPGGPFDPVDPEEGNGVLDTLRNPFGL
jgi:hypothetical protein